MSHQLADTPSIEAQRFLRQLSVPDGVTGEVYCGGPTIIAAVVDVETTGKDPRTDSIIELASRRFRHDEHGRILKIDRPYAKRFGCFAQ